MGGQNYQSASQSTIVATSQVVGWVKRESPKRSMKRMWRNVITSVPSDKAKRRPTNDRELYPPNDLA